MTDAQPDEYAPLDSITIGDRTYDLHRRRCSNCGDWHYSVMRWCGVSFANYILPPEFGPDDFEDFVDKIDDVLLMRAPEVLTEFKRDLDEVNSKHGIHADDSYRFRLLEYGRQRASALQKLGSFDAVVCDEEPLFRLSRRGATHESR